MNWIDVLCGKYKWYRKLRGGKWYQHEFTADAEELTFSKGVTWWARYNELNRYSKVVKTEIYEQI